jgi:phage-related protein (TIGR01555 family)
MGLLTRLDTWVSAITGLGGIKDRRNSYRFKGEPALNVELADCLYNDNWLAARICDIYPEEALAGGIKLKMEGADGPDLETKIHARLDELAALERVTEGAVFGRVHGDAFVLLGVEDGLQLEEPLDLERVERLNYLELVDRRTLAVRKRYADINAANYDDAELYEFNPGGSSPTAQRVVIHESRLLKFRGERTSKTAFRRNENWHYSVLHRVAHVLRDFDVSWASAANLLQTASTGLYGVHDLLGVITSEGGGELLEKRMQAISMGMSTANAQIYDKELEDFKYVSQSFAGVPDMLDRFATRISGVAGVPVTVLFGQAPAGLNATGDQDNKTWSRRRNSYAAKELKPQLERLISVLVAESKASPESWTVSFPQADQPTELEQAQLRKAVADTDALYIANQVVTPEEVAVNRFGAEGWSADMTIDLELREKILDTPPEDQPDNGDEGTVGARVTAVLDILAKVRDEQIPRETGIALLVQVCGMTGDEAEIVMDKIGAGFEPKPLAPPPGALGPPKAPAFPPKVE